MLSFASCELPGCSSAASVEPAMAPAITRSAIVRGSRAKNVLPDIRSLHHQKAACFGRRYTRGLLKDDECTWLQSFRCLTSSGLESVKPVIFPRSEWSQM